MTSRFFLTGCALVSVLTLGACDAAVYKNNPSFVTTSHAEVYQDRTEQEFATGTLKDTQMTALAHAYWSNGDGPMAVSITYDPHSKTNTAMRASTQAADLTAALKAKGIKTIQSGTLAVADSGASSRTLISYNTLVARPPGECDEPLNMNFAEREHNPGYRLGCSVEIYTAKQIARPSDLTGNNIMDNNSGRRDANIIEGYQSGQPNPDLKGVNASEASTGN
jgi:type IV pilus biogenesis protein CpaD/CtpE